MLKGAAFAQRRVVSSRHTARAAANVAAYTVICG
jgi:hypothetical protein